MPPRGGRSLAVMPPGTRPTFKLVPSSVSAAEPKSERKVGREGGPQVRREGRGSRGEVREESLDVYLYLAILAVRIGEDLLPRRAGRYLLARQR